MSRHILFVYDKVKFNEFYQKMSDEYRIIPISLLFNTSNEFKEDYLSEDGLSNGNLSFDEEDKEVLIDITLLVKLLAVRNDLLFYYGVIINNLYRRGGVNIVIEDGYSDKALELFPLHFCEKECMTNIDDVSEETNVNKAKVSLSKNIVVYDKNNFNKYISKKKGKRQKINVWNKKIFFDKLNSVVSSNASLLD